MGKGGRETDMNRSTGTAWRLSICILLLTLGCRAHAAGGEPVTQRTPVLVELFTSEGCSSCPPADRLLAQLDREQPVAHAEIIVLGEHVDYWDQLGWHDRFSSPLFTQRQEIYARALNTEGPYTPQMVIDGREQFVGGDREQALSSIARAAAIPKLQLHLSEPVLHGREVRATISIGAAIPITDEGIELYAALVDRNDTTEVQRGENGGRRLQHAGVVRTLMRIGSLRDVQSSRLAITASAPSDADLAGLRLVVFAARPGQGGIVGAALRPVPATAAVASQ